VVLALGHIDVDLDCHYFSSTVDG
ncbi:MAG: hypothetical protein RLZZ108_813, partial [Actinomycetota bacterium]